MQSAFLDGLIEGGNRLAIGLLGGGLVAFFDGLAQIAQLGAEGGVVGAVARGTTFGMAGAFQRRSVRT